ncbi:amino acid permease [Candidatus Woesearchaeota archaeon]|nr:amino acid permease [Candidatus Woesearchaeota archaeon]
MIENEGVVEGVPTRRKVGFGVIFLITLNAIFASSLTYLPGLGVQMMGARSLIAWLVTFGIGLYIAMALAELVSMFPKAGDLYVYAKKAYGHFTAFIVGWTSWIAGNISASLAVVWALEYFYPANTMMDYLFKLAVGIAIIALLNFLVFRGLTLNKLVLVILSIITVSVVVLQILPLFFNIEAISLSSTGAVSNFFSLFGQTSGFSLLILFATTFIISEAFMGMEIITFLSEEAKSRRTIPKAIIAALSVAAVTTLIYVIGSIGMFPINKYSSALIPHKDILSTLWHGTIAQQALFLGTAFMIITPALVWIFIGPNLLRSLARDRLLLESFTELHKKFKTPHRSILFQSIAISIFTAFMFFLYMRHHHDPYKLIHEVFLLLVLVVLSLTMITIPIFRKKYVELERPFKLPFGSIGPFILVGIFGLLIFSYMRLTGEVHLIWKAVSLIAVGIPVYVLLILFYNPEATRKMNNRFARFAVFFEEYNLPRSLRKKIIGEFKDLHGKTVVDFHATVGTLSLDLANVVGPQGKVIPVDLSEGNVEIIKKRAKKKGIVNIEPIHDEHLISRLHPSIHEVDAIISIGSLDYIQNIHLVLKDMAQTLPEHGEICFVEFSDFFGFIPNSSWSNNLDQLRAEFRRAGFAVKIGRWKGIFWNYVFIYGIKSEHDVVMV